MSPLNQLREAVTNNPFATALELSVLLGWNLPDTQKAISYLVSGGAISSLPKRYVIAPEGNAKALRDRARLEKFLQKKNEEKQVSADEIIDSAMKMRDDLSRAWG